MRNWFQVLVLVAALVCSSRPLLAQEAQPLGFGDNFPEVKLQSPAEPAARSYLGLGKGAEFSLSQIGAELVLVELLNVHCPHCQMQTPSYNELYKLIEANPKTRGKIKMIGFAVGNLPEEVAGFKKRFSVPFPILADPNFQLWRAVGGSSTPFSLYVRQLRPGQPGVVAGSHLGLNTHYQRLFETLQRYAASDPEELRRQGAAAARVRTAVAPVVSATELETRVRKAFINVSNGIVEFARLELRSGRQVYTAIVRQAQGVERLFAEVTSRSSVCDICHDVHFIYVFNGNGEIVGFEPLQLTKYGNVDWNQQEVATMRKRVVGKYLTAPPPFNPKLDAISSATMTSAIIFDSLAQGEQLLRELQEQGLR